MKLEIVKKLTNLNKSNLYKFVEIIKSQIELAGFSRLSRVIKIPISTLDKNGLSVGDARQLCTLINRVTEQELILNPVDEFIKSEGGKPYLSSMNVDCEVRMPSSVTSFRSSPEQEKLAELRLRALDVANAVGYRLSFVGIKESDLQIFFIIMTDKEDLLPDLKIIQDAIGVIINQELEEKKAINLFINEEGDLWRDPKKEHCYPMAKNKVRYSIVRYFAEHSTKKFTETKSVANNLSKKTQYLRVEIGKINKLVRDNLSLDPDVDLIEGRQPNGYRLNPNINLLLR